MVRMWDVGPYSDKNNHLHMLGLAHAASHTHARMLQKYRIMSDERGMQQSVSVFVRWIIDVVRVVSVSASLSL